MPKVRKFNLDIEKTSDAKTSPQIVIPDISQEVVDSVTANAPVQLRSGENKGPGNPRKRRYKQKTYSILQEDIDRIESLVATVRQAGLYERGRSDIVRAGIALLESLPLKEQIKAVEAVESLKH